MFFMWTSAYRACSHINIRRGWFRVISRTRSFATNKTSARLLAVQLKAVLSSRMPNTSHNTGQGSIQQQNHPFDDDQGCISHGYANTCASRNYSSGNNPVIECHSYILNPETGTGKRHKIDLTPLKKPEKPDSMAT